MSETAQHITREIASQPACWERAARLASEIGGDLPQRGERVVAVGCGTSLYVARALAALREDHGEGETDAFPASEFPGGRRYDRLVAISRSGTTTEVVRLLEGNGALAPSVVITADDDAPLPALAGASVALDFADERSVVQTRFATSALALLRAHLGDDLSPAIADARRALDRPLPVEPSGFDHFVFLGRGWSVGIAEEAALKLREAAQAHTEAYPAMEYRHGPISLAGTGSLIWTLGDVGPDLLADIRRTGATVVAGVSDPMAELVRIQRLAVALAEAKGLDPDRPRHLTRSVVLA
jgi:fructoselysine-6-P-deglycase FrlB-like protein